MCGNFESTTLTLSGGSSLSVSRGVGGTDGFLASVSLDGENILLLVEKFLMTVADGVPLWMVPPSE